jgi:type II secretory pathway pseudopilin PulG
MTLLEAVVALTIVATAGIAALTTVAGELRGAERARRAVEAAALAGETMTRVGLLGAADLAVLPDSVRSGVFPAPLSDYRWTTTSRAVPDQRDTYAVTVDIHWPAGGRYTLDTRWYRPRMEERVR